jgi:uncharacterized membrane protein YphA (DoxX/SURF4 family)
MTLSGAVARPLMAGIFVYGGIDALRDPDSKAKAADDVAPMIANALRLPMNDTVTLVRVNGGIQVVAGTMLALGKARRISALVLAASLVPTTYAGHRFWEEVDEQQRAQQRIHFLKNVAMLGGLVLAAGDTGGRPSLPWQARQAALHALEAAVAAGAVTEEAAKHVVESTRGATIDAKKAATAKLSRRARKAALKARRAQLADLAEQAQRLAQSAKESDITKRAMKAAEDAAKKAKKSELTRSAVKTAQKAAFKAAEEAKKADLPKRAEDATRAARKAAGQAAKKASKKARKMEPQLKAAQLKAAQLKAAQLKAAQLKAVAGQVQQLTADAVDRAREVAANGSLDRLRDSATDTAQKIAERAKEVLPVAS